MLTKIIRKKILIGVAVNYIIIGGLLIFLASCSNKYNPTTTILKYIYKNNKN